MKKSALFLLAAGVAALIWTVAYYGVTGRSIRDLRRGVTGRLILKPPPADSMLIFRFNGFSRVDFAGAEAFVEVCPDTIPGLQMKKHARPQFRFTVHDSVLIIRQLKRPGNRMPDTLLIGAPGFMGLRFYQYPFPDVSGLAVTLQELEQPALYLEAFGISRLRIEKCRVSDFTLSVTGRKPSETISIANSCSFDSVSAGLLGNGIVELGAAGRYKNQFRPSGSLRIHGAVSLLERIFRSDTLSLNTSKK